MTARATMCMPLLALLLAACSTGEVATAPAPAGDHRALERLATAYDELAQDVPMSPRRLSPEQRKDFVTRVFAKAGYSYDATLHRLAEGGWDGNDQDAKDLVALLFLPHTSMRPDDNLNGVYSDQELADVRAVQRMLPP